MGEGAALPYASSLLACVDNVSRFRAAPCESRTAFLWGFLCLGNGDSPERGRSFFWAAFDVRCKPLAESRVDHFCQEQVFSLFSLCCAFPSSLLFLLGRGAERNLGVQRGGVCVLVLPLEGLIRGDPVHE